MCRPSSPLRAVRTLASRVSGGAALLLTGAMLLGCGNRDQDRQRRFEWIHQQTSQNKLWVREFLSRSGDYEFYDGWYPVESDPKTGGAWRWMEKRGIIRLHSVVGGAKQARDMNLKLFGWVLHDDVGFRKIMMDFAVNGHVLGRLDPPKGSFEHTLFVPKWLLEGSEWVDFVITVSNTARPRGDWRDLGFCTSGFHWTPVEGS